MELSREQVAAAAGVSVEVIAAAERGGRAFSVEQFRMISACLRVSADYLLFGEHRQSLVRQETEHLSYGEE